MSLTLKLKSLLLTNIIIVTSAFIATSCDSDPPDEAVISDERAPSESNIEAGELLRFENSLDTTVEQRLDTIRATAGNLFGTAPDDFLYEKTGEFTATLLNQRDVDASVAEAVQQSLSVNNAANVEIRSLLLSLINDPDQERPDLTDAEVQRLVDILNVSGAGLFVSPDNPQRILSTPVSQYFLTTTSSIRNRFTGVAAGRYSLEVTTRDIAFTTQTFADGNGNSVTFFIPFVVTQVNPEELIERGTFNLQLINRIGF